MNQGNALPNTTPPPELPGNIPNMSDLLATYLRRFSLWATLGFQNALSSRTATGQILMLSPTKVWKITVDDTGAIHTTQMTPGSGG